MDLRNPSSLVCALLTPPGRGAVATVGVRGPQAVEAVGRRFTAASGQALDQVASVGRVFVGRFRAGAAEEELVVGVVGSAEVEVHCHGGVAAADTVMQALIGEGCQPVSPAEWAAATERNSIIAAARLALAEARTERTAAILLDQYAGALSTELERIQRDLGAGKAPAAAEALDRLLAWQDLGLHLTQPWRIIIAGRPNVGKSSLMNALVGYERAIVFDQPGTTRDVLRAATALEGWPVELADTAGLRDAEEEIEASGIERARAQITAADLVLYVVDSTAPWEPAADEQSLLETGKVLVVHNKCDVSPPPADGRPEGLAISAKTLQGLATVVAAAVSKIVPQPPPPGAAIGFTTHQFAVLAAARKELLGGRPAAAQEQLQSLTR